MSKKPWMGTINEKHMESLTLEDFMPDTNTHPEQDSLREKIKALPTTHHISKHPLGMYLSDKELDSIMHLIEQDREQAVREARIDERDTFKTLFSNLRMQFGASAGDATGVIVKNDFGEEFDFQLDRQAVNALNAYLNTQPTQERSSPCK